MASKVNKEVNVIFKLFMSEFNKEIKETDKQISTLYKELRLANAEFQNNGDKVAYVQKQLNTYQKIQDLVTEKINMTETALMNATEAYGEDSEEVRKLNDRLLTLRTSYEKNVTELNRIEKELKEATNQMVQFGKSATDVGNKLTTLGTDMQKVGKNLSIISASVTAVGVAIAKAGIDFETAFAGVEKTFPGTTAQLEELRQEIRDMALDIPATTSEIAAVAEAAGQLGIEAENIADFTRTMIDLGVATNMTSEEAATALARFANITGMDQSDFDKLASTIVELGNNFATTEKEIVDMAVNLAAAGKQVGLSEHQILAMAASLSSLGLEAQAGGTAFSKLMINMQLAVETGSEDLKYFAEIAGVTVDEFVERFGTDATDAIMLFLDGLGSSEEIGASAIKMLDDMGISEVRLRDAILRTSGATDMLNDALSMGMEAWDENNALTEEAEKRYKTTESKLKILKNTLNEVGISFAELILPTLQDILDALKLFLTRINNLDSGTKKIILTIGAFVAALGPIVYMGGTVVKAVGGIASTIGTLTTMLSGSTTAIAGLSSGAQMLAPVISALTGPIGIAIAAVAAITAAIIYLWNTNEEFRENFMILWNGLLAFITPVMDIFKAIFDTFVGNIQNAIDTLLGIFAGLIEFLAGIFTGDWNKAWNGLLGIVESIVNGIVGFVEGMVNGAIDAINALIRAANKLPFVDIDEMQHVHWTSSPASVGSLTPNVQGGNIINVEATIREEADIPRLANAINKQLGTGVK